MTRLRQANGDDYPAAAAKHLLDSAALLATGRADGAAYLSGYVVECALKSLLAIAADSVDRTHDLAGLREQVAELAVHEDGEIGRCCGTAERLLLGAAVLDWAPAIRYRAEEMSIGTAETWQREAAEVYGQVVGALVLEGRL